MESESHVVSRADARVLREPETVARTPLLHRLLENYSLVGLGAAKTWGAAHTQPSQGERAVPGWPQEQFLPAERRQQAYTFGFLLKMLSFLFATS